MNIKTLTMNMLLACSIVTLAACSSSGDDDPVATSTTISGSIFAAPINGAEVSVEDMSGNTVAGPVVTDADGAFTVTIPNANLASTLVFQSTDGTFTDEATSSSTPAGAMSVMVEAGGLSANNNVHATPDSEIIYTLVSQHNMTMADASTVFTSAFGYTPDHTIAPTDAASPDAGAEETELLAGLRAAAFSQLTMELNLEPQLQFDLLDALARDLSDGALNGIVDDGAGNTTPVSVGNTNLPEDIQNRFVTALLNFHNNGLMGDVHGNDQTGLTSDKIGPLPFAKVALTDSYKVEYEGKMNAVEGKTAFTLRVTNLMDGTPADTLSPTLMPMMYMPTMTHSTPVGTINNNNDGTYDATIYYLMTSMMGYWDLGVMLNMTETAHFYPNVMMPMDGSTAKIVLRGLSGDDVIPTMDGLEVARPYILFKESLTENAGKHDFSIFLAARETMMSHPAIDQGVILNQGTEYELTVASVTVEMFRKQGTDWIAIPVTNDGSGYFSATGIEGLQSDTSVDPDTGLAPIRVKLSINGIQKTTDSAAPVLDENDYQTFYLSLP